MPADAYEGALDDPATRRVCNRARRTARAVFVLSIVALPGFPVVMVIASLPTWLIYPFTVLVLAVFIVSDLRLRRLRRYVRILGVYSWEVHTAALFLADGDAPYARLTDPENPKRSITIRVRLPDVRRWRGIVNEQPKQEVWFAGDPRIGGVLALPGPRCLALVRQRGAAGHADAESARREGGSLHGMSEEALARAHAAGFAAPDKQYGPRVGFLR